MLNRRERKKRGALSSLFPSHELDQKPSVVVRVEQAHEIGLSVFERIRGSFPTLTMNLDLHPKHVDLAMDIPAQPGLAFRVHLNLQNMDELHLSASALWVEWFPCTKPPKAEKYFEAVSGLLSGEFRILEHWRGKRSVKAQLQRPNRGGWKDVATSLNMSAVVPWPPKSFKVVQNLPTAVSAN
jgi:hypothetical protein